MVIERITLKTDKTKLVEQRFLGWHQRGGVHKSKKAYDRKRAKRQLREELR